MSVLVSCLLVSGIMAFAQEPKTSCDINAGHCIKTTDLDNVKVIFDCMPKPVKSMSELTFIVTLKENKESVTDARVELDLTMPGMFMGKNRMILVHKGKGRYEGNGVIVRCPSGKKIWKADVIIKRPSKKTASVDYIFEVKN